MKTGLTLFFLLVCFTSGLISPQYVFSTVYVDQSYCLYCHTHGANRIHDKHDSEECIQCHDGTPEAGNDNIGDACECEGNFDCDEDCDGTDAATFKADFGRGGYNNPCATGTPCNGDFDCDEDVDGSDAALFKADFGRGGYTNPCPTCVVEEWCAY